MYTLTLKTPPLSEPITAAQAIEYLHERELVESETKLLETIIKSAREYCENIQHRAYITQTWEMSLDKFPVNGFNPLLESKRSDVIEIPKGSLQSINSIKYTDSAGAEHTLTENVDYIVSKRGLLGKVSPPYGCTWPSTVLYPLDPIVIEFTCGYGDATKVPSNVIGAMYMLIAYWWENRLAAESSNVSKEVAFSAGALLSFGTIPIV